MKIKNQNFIIHLERETGFLLAVKTLSEDNPDQLSNVGNGLCLQGIGLCLQGIFSLIFGGANKWKIYSPDTKQSHKQE